MLLLMLVAGVLTTPILEVKEKYFKDSAKKCIYKKQGSKARKRKVTYVFTFPLFLPRSQGKV